MSEIFPDERVPHEADQGQPITIEELVEISRRLFPQGTESSVELIRHMGDGR